MKAPRTIIANLDCEAEMAALHTGASQQNRLPAGVLRHISGPATLLRVFASSNDILWTPCPVESHRLTGHPQLPTPTMIHGVKPTGTSGILAWGETESIAKLRNATSNDNVPSTQCSKENWIECLWSMPSPDPAIVRFMNHRRTASELALKIGTGLPGATMVHNMAEFQARVADLENNSHWVVKTPFSAAGRERVIGHGEPRPHDHKRISKWLKQHGEMNIEPWVDRRADFGMLAIATPEGNQILGSHRLIVDKRGSFRGIHWIAGENRAPGIEASEQVQLTKAMTSVLELARSKRYFGPLSIDAWRYASDNQEHTNFNALGEINARLSFGFVARAIERILMAPEGTEMLLEFSLEELPNNAEWILAPIADEPGIALTQSLGRR